MKKELLYEDIVYKFDIDGIETDDLLESMPEYSKALKDIKMALNIEKQGYNVYLIDDFTNEKVKKIKKVIQEEYKYKDKPRDICYVVFDDPKSPKVMYLTNGKGREFSDTVRNIQNIYEEATYDFYNGTENDEKESIIDTIENTRSELIGKLIIEAKDVGFQVRYGQNGFTFLPINDDGIMTEKEYNELNIEKKGEILKNLSHIKKKAEGILNKLKQLEDTQINKIRLMMLSFYNDKVHEVKQKYIKNFRNDEEAVVFLDDFCNYVQSNLVDNYTLSYEDDEEKINEIINTCFVNVVVDNKNYNNPRVIYEEDVSISNLLGTVEYENKNGLYYTDVSLIKAGALLKANEGCLILRINNLLSNPQSYYSLKKVLMTGKVDMNYNKGYFELLSLSGLKVEPAKINVKIILIGDYTSYDLLYNYDVDFRKIFKIKAEYNPLINIDEKNKKALLSRIAYKSKKNTIKPIEKNAILEIGKYLSRRAENRNKVYFNDDDLEKLLILADEVSREKSCITKEDISKIVYKEDITEKDSLQFYKDKKLLISVTGEKVGQINGLSVIDTGYFSFGRPMRITCTCYKGNGEVIDIQKENSLSGSIHSKSISILEGYISNLTGGYNKIPVNFNLSFEQLYGKIDGDSASVAETIAMISALSKVPIKQNIAVTGSVNQFGEVQPVGGLIYKIEGFFKVCKEIDSEIDKGVLIPEWNSDDLVLSEEVEDAIKCGKFHIYTMNNIVDAIDTLMGNKQNNSKYVFSELNKELKKYYKKS